ncbi:hypothetical protein ACGF13_35035 [Kitasatospora sp. NPDC048286]|uniref:hypothetical protein n=1 Tax=Kitasatospora sp. NPDC048286 TaxID=3364047 RepID=UPI00371CDE27
MALPRELLFEKIRRDRRQDPMVSGRQLALRYKVSRNTVAEALRSPVPRTRKKPEPRTSVLEPVKGPYRRDAVGVSPCFRQLPGALGMVLAHER